MMIKMQRSRIPLPARALTRALGQSVVEILVAMALMGMVSLSIANFLIKSNVTSASLNSRFRGASEIHAWVDNLRAELAKGAYISMNSHKHRLEYTTYDNNGNAAKRYYRITTVSGSQYLQYSEDGTDWTSKSPYKISSWNAYKLTGSPKFIYSTRGEFCTEYTDTNGNGVWNSGDASASSPCSGSVLTGITGQLSSDTIVLRDFVFTTGKGSPEAKRALPSELFLSGVLFPDVPVVSYAAASSPAAKDMTYATWFTADATFLFGGTFSLKGVAYDPSRDRVITVGTDLKRIYVTDTRGILIGQPYTVTKDLKNVAIKGGNTIYALESELSSKKIYELTLGDSTSLNESKLYDIAALIDSPTAIAYDASTPNFIYVVGFNPGTTTNVRIKKINLDTLTTDTTWTLPAGASYTSTYMPTGMAIEPTTGDFLLVRNQVSGTDPNKTINIYRHDRSSTSAPVISGYPMTVNISELNSSATGATGQWGLSFDPVRNHLFLSDVQTKSVFQIIPDRLISPRQ